ncbi:MAG: hypothetical protein ACR650_16595 [Methylocystis sp.]
MSDNEQVRNEEMQDNPFRFQNPDPVSWYTDPAVDAIEMLLPKVDSKQMIEIKLSVNLAELKEWHTERWSRARPHSVADKIYVNEPNPWLSQYPQETQDIVRHHGKNEAGNPLNRIHNEKLVELSHQWDGYAWDEYDDEEERAEAQLATWVDMENFLFENWTRYIDSGLAGKLSFDEFRVAFKNIKMIVVRELVEREGERVANEHVPSFPLSEEAKQEIRKLWESGRVR